MTKLREPVSIENALRLTLGRLTIERAAEVTGRTIGYLSALTDPDKRETLTVHDLQLLDQAMHAEFGEGFPLYEALGRRMESAAAERFADQAAIGRVAGVHALEAGEATAAMIAAALPGASISTIEHALREVEQADAATDAAVVVLRNALQHAKEGQNPHPPP